MRWKINAILNNRRMKFNTFTTKILMMEIRHVTQQERDI